MYDLTLITSAKDLFPNKVTFWMDMNFGTHWSTHYNRHHFLRMGTYTCANTRVDKLDFVKTQTLLFESGVRKWKGRLQTGRTYLQQFGFRT